MLSSILFPRMRDDVMFVQPEMQGSEDPLLVWSREWVSWSGQASCLEIRMNNILLASNINYI